MTTETKIFKSRDSATALLKKLGIEKASYNNYISKTSTGVEVDMAAVKATLTKPVKPKTSKTPRTSCSSVAKELILSGKTNQEVWDVISKQFKLDATKKHYPTWYRYQLKRRGELK